MRINDLVTAYFSKLPKEIRFDGDELYRARKGDFRLLDEQAGYREIRMPAGVRGSRTTTLSFGNDADRGLYVFCQCIQFKSFGYCKHVAAGAIFLTRKPPVASRQAGDDAGVWSAQTEVFYSLSVLFHIGVGKLGLKIKPILKAEEKAGTSFQRFSGLPQWKEILTNQLAPDVRTAIDRLDISYEHFLQYENNGWFAENENSQVEKFSKFYFSRLRQFLPIVSQIPDLFSLTSPDRFQSENLKPFILGAGKPVPEFQVVKDDDTVRVKLFFIVNNEPCYPSAISKKSPFFISKGNVHYLLSDYQHVQLLKQYGENGLAFPLDSLAQVYTGVLAPLKRKYKITLAEELGLKFKQLTPEPFVLVAEYLNNYLMFIPHFIYEDSTVAYQDKKEVLNTAQGAGDLIERDYGYEKQFFENLRALHPAFAKQLQHPFFYVPFKDVMKGHWFLKTIRKLQTQNIQVRGFQKLKKFKYNTSIPKFKLTASSGIDWFEIKASLSFGEMRVPLQDIQNAVFSGQNVVVLSDGALGVLPEDWLRQFDSVIRLGKVKGQTIRLDKRYFNLLLDLDLQIREEKMLQELQEKKKALVNIGEVKVTSLSKKIKATLRPYQVTGFQWMQSLDHFGWGGCLADDMGLGKTLQTISFLQFVKDKYSHGCNLVVCPTSLIYNWEDELKRFAPELKYFIYYGQDRRFQATFLKKYDIIITSYGTVRNDIDTLREHPFQYIILDESQTIKNPVARITRTCQLLNAKNRLILSGTPVQNNTFDLYAQMNFLNPGFLGSLNFFKNQFSVPIDKFGNKEAAARLRKLTEPFILRRTKEKVAKDLPAKSEFVLWCSMKDQQKEVYDRYRDYFKGKLLTLIDKEGIQKASMEIVTGLTRLRQICDSPVLVKDPSVTYTGSAKLEQLVWEISENNGDHKVLVFSQFTEMLSLVKSRFEKEGITYCYLDGKTPTKRRKELVDTFQTDARTRVFLISLKAGGVGLNLTAADYVYIVDPWWNPAVEAQAIDRVHRIGQTQKVFAYKMICKDTIEEKILELQQKKIELSNDLISEEKSFVGQLNKADIEFLFSK